MTFLTTKDIQTWLEATKLTISATEPDNLDELELFYKNTLFGRLSQKFSVSSWASATTTPSLVKQCIAMMVAAAVYRRAYSEDLISDNNWAAKLEGMVEALINGLLDGSTVLLDEVGITGTPSSLNQPAFYPTDTSSATDGEPYFSMGRVF